ncbi:MAG: hypothetical protein H0X66_06425 [Verrucomicrobia bacterium]|nr:hypothetical protein [Verrucomicrobiota bacterium]
MKESVLTYYTDYTEIVWKARVAYRSDRAFDFPVVFTWALLVGLACSSAVTWRTFSPDGINVYLCRRAADEGSRGFQPG